VTGPFGLDARTLVAPATYRLTMQDDSWWAGFSSGPTRIVGAASGMVFLVTAVLWLATRTAHWPGGYLPWLLSLGFSLGCGACYLNFRDMRDRRHDAERALARHLDRIRYRLEFIGVKTTDLIQDRVAALTVLPFQFIMVFENGGTDEPIEFEVASACFTIGSTTSDPLDPSSIIALPGRAKEFRCSLMSGVGIADLRFGGKCEYSVRYGPAGQPFLYENRCALDLQPVTCNEQGLPVEWRWTLLAPMTHEAIAQEAPSSLAEL